MWREYPALLWGLAMLLGCCCAFQFHPTFLIAGLAILGTIFKKEPRHLIRCSGFLIIATLSFWQSKSLEPKNDLPGDHWEGVGYFSPSNIKASASPFHTQLCYEGIFKIFETSRGSQALRLPCRIYLPKDHLRPRASTDFLLSGTLHKKKNGSYIFKPKKNSEWIPIEHSWNWVELRYQAKEKLNDYLADYFSPKTASFFQALLTGDIQERLLSLEFKRLGLQHILAISGFHFGLMAAFLGFFLHLFFSFRISYVLLFCSILFYFAFLGEAPSVSRAWVATSLAIMGILLKRKCDGLNAMGLGLILALLSNPQSIHHLGFQLSFLCTLSIFLFCPLIENFLGIIFPKRTVSKVLEFSLPDQHGAILSALIRKGLALNVSVHLTTLPVLLFLFHQFPCLSLLYNLFFPVGVTISFFCLLLGMLGHLLFPPLGTLIHHINNKFTELLLQVCSNPPPILDLKLHVKTLPFSFVVLYLTLLLCLGLKLNLFRNSDSTDFRGLLRDNL